MLPRSQYFLEDLVPILRRLPIYLYYDMPDQRWTDTFVSKRKMNVRRVTAVEFEDRPYRGAHLLTLHVGGITRNAQSQESNKGCDDGVVSAGAARLLLLRHGGDHIAGAVSVNQAGNRRDGPALWFDATISSDCANL